MYRDGETGGKTDEKQRRGNQKPLPEEIELRIIGGHFRNSKLRYHGDPVTRPMKERVRESLFNLVSTETGGKHAIDLFAGTGALGLEAISRGATSALFIEKHIPTARVVEENIATLGLQDRTVLHNDQHLFVGQKRSAEPGSRLVEGSQFGGRAPLVGVLQSPYSFFVDRENEMLELINALLKYAPSGSIF